MKLGLSARPSTGTSGRHAAAVPNYGSAGFTIVETLIVLAVSGALFTSAILLINGKQNVTSFNQSIRDVQTQLQRVVSDVGSGYYPNNGNIACAEGGPMGGIKLTTSAKAQGTNRPCAFMGKVLQFSVDNLDSQAYNEYTLVGLSGYNGASNYNPVDSLTAAKARVIARGTSSADASVPADAFAPHQLLYGMTVAKMYYNNNPAQNIGAFGFSSRLTSVNEAEKSQQVDLLAITGTDLGQTQKDGVDRINGNITSITPNPANGVQICFKSGGSNQSGLITIGGGNRQGSVNIQKIFNNQTCS